MLRLFSHLRRAGVRIGHSARAATALGLLAAPGLLAALGLLAVPCLPAAGGEWPGLRLEPVASGLDLPYDLTHAGDGSGRLFIALAGGRIVILEDGAIRAEPFLDISDRVGCCGERALTSIAFSPTYTDDGHFFVLYSDTNEDSVLSRFAVGKDPNRADAKSETILLTIPQPDIDHNANEIAFGPDGYLYVAVGDGGEQEDPCRRGQNPADLRGKILRLDVSAAPYLIPPDNPWSGVPGARPELWAIGLRNPWRMGFDRRTGDLLIGDAGEFSWEELNVIGPGEGGLNFGWSVMEGEKCFTPTAACEDGEPYVPPLACGDVDLRTPALSRCHIEVPDCPDPECAIIGGFVYRGHLSPELRGIYVFSDWCHGEVWGARQNGEKWQAHRLLVTGLSPLSFGEGEDGELYYLAAENGQILRLQGLPEGFADDFEAGTVAAWDDAVGAVP